MTSSIDRRTFLSRSALAAGAAGAGISLSACEAAGRTGERTAEADIDYADWDAVRGSFGLDPSKIHLAAFVLASHPAPVRAAIERYRAALDRDTVSYLNEKEVAHDGDARIAIANYLGADHDTVALTDSTTMGLGLLYGGIHLREGQEAVMTEHDFYSTHEALRLRAEQTGATIRTIRLFEEASTASEDEIVSSVMREIKPNTRILAVTWVHSSTGMKLPIRTIADALADVNARRDEIDSVLLCVDGVHGFGIEDETLESLGCDFLVSGCHKWLFGPRGTGFVAGTRAAWATVKPTIPTFEIQNILAWINNEPRDQLSAALMNTPGGFKAFEHRWALKETVEFHFEIGKDRIAERTHSLVARLKEGLAEIPRVTIVTPMDEQLSAGIVCFNSERSGPPDIVEGLKTLRGVIASVTPYAEQYVRMGPSLATNEEDIDETLRVLRTLV